MKARLKTWLLCASLALNLAGALVAWKLAQWDADLATLHHECDRGLVVEWRYRDGVKDTRFPSLREILLGARADEVHIDYQGFDSDLAAIDTFGAALRRFGTLHEVSIGQGNAAAIEHLLAALGPQPELTDLYCFDGDLSDAASKSLVQFPRLKNLAIVGASFTGADFPRLPALTTFDCSWNPTTLPGLRRIAACPLLKKLKLREPDEGSAEYRQSVATLRTEHPALEIFGME